MKKTTEHIRNSENKAIYLGAVAFLVLSIAILIAWPFFRPIPVVSKYLPYEYTVHGTYVEINRYTGDEEEVEIPGWIWFRPVKVLGYYREGYSENGAFESNDSIRKVSMPDSIREMGADCFRDCHNLEEVCLSEGLKDISSAAFYRCSSLRHVEIPEGVEYIGPAAFSTCESLESVRLPESLKKIERAAFRGCEVLEYVEIPEGVEEIEGDSFMRTGWEKNFQEDFVVVGKNVLIYYGGNEREVKVPEGVEYIGSYVFELKEEMKYLEMESLELPASLKKCDNLMVSLGCEKLKYVMVRNPSTEFGSDRSLEVFRNCNPELTLIGEKGSTAEAYAEKWGHGFMELQPEE